MILSLVTTLRSIVKMLNMVSNPFLKLLLVCSDNPFKFFSILDDDESGHSLDIPLCCNILTYIRSINNEFLNNFYNLVYLEYLSITMYWFKSIFHYFLDYIIYICAITWIRLLPTMVHWINGEKRTSIEAWVRVMPT